MSTTIPVSRCTVKPRSACKIHGEIDHKRFDVELAENEYKQAQADYDLADPKTRDLPVSNWARAHGGKSALQNRIANAKSKFNRVQASLDAIPSEHKLLVAAADAAAANGAANAKELAGRVKRSNALIAKNKREAAAKKAEEKRLASVKAANKVEFEKIKKEVAERAPEKLPLDQQWKIGYQKAIANVVFEQGTIVDGTGTSSYGMYFPATNREKTDHLRSCGALDIRNVEEEAWDEWDFNSMSSVQSSHQEYAVRGEATCNCGQLVKAKIEVHDSFSNIVASVLKF